MSIIGLAVAVGHVVDIPIITRSIAESLGSTTEDFVMPIEADLLEILDAGIDSERPARIDTQYACNWWDQVDEPEGKYVLCAETVVYCLEVHDECRAASANPELPISGSGSGLGSGSASAPKPIPSTAKSKESAIAVEGQSRCSSCPSLCLEIVRLQEALQNCGTYASAMSTTFEHNWDIGMRRAAGFHTLHQMAILKELDSENIPHSVPFPSITRPSGTTARKRAADIIATRAKTDLERLMALPPASHKWTWGVDLTEAEVLSIEHMRYKARRNSHSEYNLSLPDGGVNPHSPSATPVHSGNTESFEHIIPHSERLPPVSSDIASAPRNVGKFDPLSRYPSPEVGPTPQMVVNSESDSILDTAAAALAWDDADSELSHQSGSDSASASAFPDFTALATAWNDHESASDLESARASPDFTALAQAWNEADMESDDDSEEELEPVLDMKKLAEAWSDFDSDASASAKGSEKTSEGISSEPPTHEISEQTSEESELESASVNAVQRYGSSSKSNTGRPDLDEDMASATGEAGDSTIDSNLRASPAKITIVKRYHESDFQFVDETYIAASGFADAKADDEADSSDEE